MSDTPRTYAVVNPPGDSVLMGNSLSDALVPSSFARQLERELNEILAKWDAEAGRNAQDTAFTIDQ